MRARFATACLSAAFFVSGASALAFETVWFRQLGLVFGNGVWATGIVLASFMGGLALGNLLSSRVASRFPRPLHAYAALEVVVALAGAAIVLALPGLRATFASILAPLADVPWALNACRLFAAFTLLAIPTTAMGMTLPVLVKALARQASFGVSIGRLYGWNTLGAVAGTLASEMWLIRAFGVRGTGMFAALLNLVAAVGALAIAPRLEAAPQVPHPPAAAARGGPAEWRILSAAFLAGGILLGLEVLWFRLLLLFAIGSSTTFAVMLAVVLAGIGFGGLGASAWLARDPAASRHSSAVALAAGASCVATYALFDDVLVRLGFSYVIDVGSVILRAAFLMLGVSLASGVLFTLLAAALERTGGDSARVAGRLTFANTVGALLGSLAAAFAMLPALGLEASLFTMAAGYGVVALLAGTSRSRRLLSAAAVYVALLALFPWGSMASRYLLLSVKKYAGPETYVVAVREGTTETSAYLLDLEQGEPEYHRLITNGFSMSGTYHSGQRYMKLYVYLPVALHPAPRDALLISYGVGSTARALADTTQLRTIDVVDISRDILEMSGIPHGAADPLRDPRVAVHVEDGRYFLQATARRYDLITAEPPPPKNAGVANLYTAEYFALARSRLRPGGFITYWLPVHSLEEDDSRAIVRAFCGAFADCTLWGGTDLDWMLAGSNGAGGRVDEAAFRRQWDDATVGPEMRRLGIENPEQLGALFMADARMLAAFAGAAEPLVDDRPQRLTPYRAVPPGAAYAALADPSRARDAFASSAWIAARWPAALRARTLDFFAYQGMRDGVYWGTFLPERKPSLFDLHRVLTGSTLEALPILLLGSSPDRQRVASSKASRGDSGAWTESQLAIAAIARRDYASAVAHAARAEPSGDPERALRYAYALCLAGRREDAQEFLDRHGSTIAPEARGFLSRTFALRSP